MKPIKILILSESTSCLNNTYSDFAEIERRISAPDSFEKYHLTAIDLDSNIILKDTPLSTVAFSKEFTVKTEDDMKNRSIPFFVHHTYLKHNLVKIGTIFDNSYTDKKIAVFSPHKERNIIIKAVLRLFNYDMVEIFNFNDLFALNDSEISFILADISSKSFSSEQYVKKALFGRLKFIPFIPFYTENGIGISDVACGLNKVARFIVSFDEMMSFLSHNLSSHEIFTENKKLNDFFNTHKNKDLFSHDLKSDYHQNYKNMILTQKDFSDSDETLISQIEKLHESMIKRELVKWLIIEETSPKKAMA